MKVVHVTTRHGPDDVRIRLKESRTLARAGYEVILAAPVESESRADGVTAKPVGITEIREGIPNLAARLTKVLAAVRRERAELYHLHDPELIPLALALKLDGSRVVYDAHEDTPAEVLALGRSRARVRAVQARIWAAAEAVAGAVCDGIVAATPRIAERFPPEKTALVRNFPLREEADAFAAAGLAYDDRPPELVYLGQLSAGRGMAQLVRAIEGVPVEGARLVLAGPVHPGEPGLVRELSRLPGWERVRYAGVLARQEVASTLGHARAGIAVLPPTLTHLDALPVKLFEYMAAGLPTVVSDFPLWRAIVEPERCGLLVDSNDPAAIAEAITRILRGPDDARAMGERGRAAFERSYSWDSEADVLLGLYGALLADRPAKTDS